MSVDWPGGKGTMMRIGLAGHACAKARGANVAVAADMRTRRRLSMAVEGPSLLPQRSLAALGMTIALWLAHPVIPRAKPEGPWWVRRLGRLLVLLRGMLAGDF